MDDFFDPDALDAAEKVQKEKHEADTQLVVAMLKGRRDAYKRVFSPGERTQAEIDIVLNDLMYFCRMTVPTFDISDGQHADILSRIKEGRREVFMRIRDFSALDLDAILLKYTSALVRSNGE